MPTIKAMSRKNFELHDQPVLPFLVLRKFRLIYGAVRQHFREIESHCGVSGSQLWMLKEIGGDPGIGVSELAARLSVHQSTCSQLLEKLVSRGLVIKARSKSDQRRVGLTLSSAASRMLARAPGPPEGVLPEALHGMSGAQLKRLDASLSELMRQMNVVDSRMADKPLSDL